MGISRHRVITAGIVAATALAAVLVITPTASAAPCSDVELVFARGRNEAPGAGQIGNALVSALRSKTGKNVSLYAVNYPADTESIWAPTI